MATYDSLGQSVGGCLGSRAPCFRFFTVLSKQPLLSGRSWPAHVGGDRRIGGLSGAKRMRLICGSQNSGHPCRVTVLGGLPRDELLCGPAPPVSAWPYSRIGISAQCQGLSFALTPVNGSDNSSSLFLQSPTIRRDGTLVFRTREGMWGKRKFDVRVTDSGGLEAPSAQVTIDVISVNDPPTFTSFDVYLNEGSGYQELTFSNDVSAGLGDHNQSLNFWFTYTDGGKGLISGVPSMSISGKQGKVAFRSVPGRTGVVHFTVTLVDNGPSDERINRRSSTSQSFRVIIRGVNQPPKFRLLPSVDIERDGPVAVVPAFATNMSTGRQEEENQRLTFSLGRVEVLDSLWPPEGLFEVFRITTEGMLTLQAAADRSGIFNVSVLLRDSGGTAFGGRDTAEQWFVLRVLPLSLPQLRGPTQVRVPQAPVDVPAVFPSAYQITLGNKTLSTQLSLSVSNISNPSLFTVLPAISDTGSLTFTPRAQLSGASVMRVSIARGSGMQSASISLTIFVDSINDPPSFSVISTVTVTQGSGRVRIPNVAREISAGPPDEAWQIVTFSVSYVSSSPDLAFIELPRINEEGTLSFQAAPEAHGVVTLTVCVCLLRLLHQHDGICSLHRPLSSLLGKRFTVADNESCLFTIYLHTNMTCICDCIHQCVNMRVCTYAVPAHFCAVHSDPLIHLDTNRFVRATTAAGTTVASTAPSARRKSWF
jgi:hypothetical protein